MLLGALAQLLRRHKEPHVKVTPETRQEIRDKHSWGSDP